MTEESLKDRCLRTKRGHSYKDDGIDDDEIYGQRSFDLQSKLDNYPDDKSFCNEMKGSDVTLAYFQQNGFKTPILVVEKTGLGMRMPSENFTINDVKKCVGSWRMVDVMDVTTQKDMEMTMKEWVIYYENTKRDRLLNVISLEFSHTKLENYVDQPAVVHDLDWVDLAWPSYLKEMQTSATNLVTSMKYPKVQKYCLMSVAGCYTDFHIDMGGTSVWYHILRGKKIFWFIEPTEENLKLYENWTLSAKQSDVFFGDMVKKCYRITLEAGNTFFIPTGWIHAVYTPCDSLVFGGNFLHSFSIDIQLRIWEVEIKTHVPMKFRYPFFMELHWYVLERYLYTLSGKKYFVKLEDEIKEEALPAVDNEEVLKEESVPQFIEEVTTARSSTLEIKSHKYLTPHEIGGLQLLILWLQSLPGNKLNVPRDIIDPHQLLADLRIVLGVKELNNHSRAVTGIPLLERLIAKKTKKYLTGGRGGATSRPRAGSASSFGKTWNYRRVRCKQCEPCTRNDCAECYACVDMKKFGGPGILKKPCLSRQCMQPVLPATAICFTCKIPAENKMCIEPGVGLLECTICFEVHHRECLEKVSDHSTSHQGCVDEDFPSSWECSRCCSQGKQGQGKARFRPPTTAPGESGRKGGKRNGSLPPADNDDSSPDLDDSVASHGSTKSFNRSRGIADEPLQAKKIKMEDKLSSELQLSESMVVLTRLRPGCHDASGSNDRADVDDDAVDHSYSSKAFKDTVPSEISATSAKKTKERPIRVALGKTAKRGNEDEAADSDLESDGIDEADELSRATQSAQKLNSRGRIISKPHRYMD